MLNGSYDMKTEAGAVKIMETATRFTIAILNDDAAGSACLAAIKSRILFDGGTLFNVETDEYVVGSVDMLMKKGR